MNALDNKNSYLQCTWIYSKWKYGYAANLLALLHPFKTANKGHCDTMEFWEDGTGKPCAQFFLFGIALNIGYSRQFHSRRV